MASRTSEYYKKNPAARRRRLKQQSEVSETKTSRVKKRVELNRINRKVGKKGDGKDVSPIVKVVVLQLESASKNRATKSWKT